MYLRSQIGEISHDTMRKEFDIFDKISSWMTGLISRKYFVTHLLIYCYLYENCP